MELLEIASAVQEYIHISRKRSPTARTIIAGAFCAIRYYQYKLFQYKKHQEPQIDT